MAGVKELKSLDLTSYTLTVTGIAVLFSVLSAILAAVAIAVASPEAAAFGIYLFPTIIVATLMYTTYNSFFGGFLYNILAKRLNTPKFALNDNNEIVRVTTTETAIICAIILTVKVILLYLVSVIILPLFINAIIQTMMYSGEQTVAYSLYQLLMLISQPTTVAIIIFGTLIITFVFVLLGCYIYNFLAKSGKGVIVNLSKEGNMTAVDSIDVKRLAIALGVVFGVLNAIFAIVSLTGGGNFASLIVNIIAGFISGLINGALIAVFYNFLTGKLGKLKMELIDRRIN